MVIMIDSRIGSISGFWLEIFGKHGRFPDSHQEISETHGRFPDPHLKSSENLGIYENHAKFPDSCLKVLNTLSCKAGSNVTTWNFLTRCVRETSKWRQVLQQICSTEIFHPVSFEVYPLEVLWSWSYALWISTPGCCKRNAISCWCNFPINGSCVKTSTGESGDANLSAGFILPKAWWERLFPAQQSIQRAIPELGEKDCFLPSTSCHVKSWEENQTDSAEATILFFCAHAVRARSSDGHKNVLSLIGYSHLLENRWKGTQGVCGNQKTKQAKHSNQTQTKRQRSPTPSNRKWNTTLSEVSPCLSVLHHDEIATSLIVIPPVPNA